MNINATLIVQIVVFLGLWWFTARYVWPPITKALDERSQKIADGLAAADKAVSLSHGAPEILDTQARVHFEMGDAAKALEIERQAVAGAEKAGITGENLDEMKEALKRYEEAAKARKG